MYIYEIGAMTKFYNDGTPEKALDWRAKVDKFMKLKGEKSFNAGRAYNPNTLALNYLGSLAVDQNEYYINKCDIAICNLEAIDFSPGSIYELAIFKMQGKPVIAFGEPHWSPHVNGCITCTVPTLEEALDLINVMFF